MSEPTSTEFRFEGQRYRIPLPSQDQVVIVLPDGRLLCPGIWLESHPIQPGYLTEITQAEAKDLPKLTAILDIE